MATFYEWLEREIRNPVFGELARFAVTHDGFPRGETTLEEVRVYLDANRDPYAFSEDGEILKVIRIISNAHPDPDDIGPKVGESLDYAWRMFTEGPPQVTLNIDLSAVDAEKKP